MDNRYTAALTACSDALSSSRAGEVSVLETRLAEMGFDVRRSPCIFSDTQHPFDAKEKARILNGFFADENVQDIFDISGGDLANEVIPYLDFETIRNSRARFWGYSDLTAIINAIYAKTGKTSALYQVRNILTENKELLFGAVSGERGALFSPSFHYIKGTDMSGVVVGGNIRCFLKLAGTDCFPNLDGKLLLLESLSGGRNRVVTLLTQLKMMGAFRKAAGVLLGTFTELDDTVGREDSLRLISSLILETSPDIPIAYTDLIGHSKNSLAAVIGAHATIDKNGRISYNTSFWRGETHEQNK